MNPIQGTTIIIRQLVDLLETFPEGVYKKPLDVFHGSTVGQHVRHVVDFYLCLLRSRETREVDYDKRERDPRIETEVSVTIATLAFIEEQIQSLDETEAVSVMGCFTPDDTETVSGMPSSYGRELMYAYDHAVHHLAIIRMGLQVDFPDMNVDPDLGVAPSTLRYKKRFVK